jgi:hypothetical protein
VLALDGNLAPFFTTVPPLYGIPVSGVVLRVWVWVFGPLGVADAAAPGGVVDSNLSLGELVRRVSWRIFCTR